MTEKIWVSSFAWFGVFLMVACHEVRAAPPLKLIDGGESQCVVVHNATNQVEAFAVSELQEIVHGTTGVALEAIDLSSPQSSTTGMRILVGRNALVESLLGKELLESLRDQESLVTRRGNDLILTGGDDWGVIYAVYDFVENEGGYRYYAPYPGGEYFRKSDSLVYSGKETRTIPAFPGFRICYTSPLMFRGAISDFSKFSFRNRGTRLDWEKYNHWEKDKKSASFANDIGLKEQYKSQLPGGLHGLFFYVSPIDRTWCFWRGSGKPALKGSFEEHPEYFSLNEKGERVDNAQLCFSNPELRKLFTERVLEAIKVKGAGVYMIGSNDNHGGTYCFCPGCLELQKKYDCTGGPLWDYILELCETLKKDYPDVYITSLAYKGAKQTEIAPDNIKFPKNFICDAALLNCYTLKETKPVEFAGGIILNNFDKYANLKKWVEITDHVSYWYYGGDAPYQIYERIQKEMKELHEAGVKSVGSCGLGSMEFGDLSTYIYFRLLINPDLNAKKLVKEFCDFKYGAAAPIMISIIDELEKMRRENVGDRTKAMFSNESYDKMTFIKAEQLLRWQENFEKMLELVKDDPVRARNVRIARTAVDCWTIINMPKIRAEFPKEKFDTKELIDRGLASADEAIEAGMTGKDRQSAKRFLNDMSLYANLKDDSLPAELAKYPKEKVIRYLPVFATAVTAKRGASLSKDPEAISGWTMKEKVEKSKNGENGCKIEFYDAFDRKWIKMIRLPQDQIVPGKYKMYNLFTARLPSRCRLVFHFLWGSSLDIMKLGRYYDPTYHERQYEYWANLKFEGPVFDSDSKATNSYISCDQVFLVNKGKKKD